MIAYDTDVLVELLKGHPDYAAKARAIPADEQLVPIVVVEEIQRGCLHSIRRAEAGEARISIERAYELYEQTFVALRGMPLLSYSRGAEVQFQDWRRLKVRGSTHDLRIAAICVAYSVTLITRNRRDFEQLPGLTVEFWE
jgi:tRNA(fMet)-specific endonuclease VapC